mmetsp:Transcript_73600/g.122946  ORF Transcript_73600/g.122946 Transcript_73600/m.122946 type:complete len:149 (-) Transcript_73600:222-668(-)
MQRILHGLHHSPVVAYGSKSLRGLCTLPAVTTLPSGLKFQEIYVPTAGPVAQDGDEVLVHYTGRLVDGEVFDTSLDKDAHVLYKNADGLDLKGWDRGYPIQFVLGKGQVIEGWDEGICGMRVGGTRKLIVPPKLGYGSQGAGPKIPPE